MPLSHLDTLPFSPITSWLLFFSLTVSLLGLPLLGLGCEDKHGDGWRRGYENCWEWNYQGMEVKYRGINGYIGLWAIILTLFSWIQIQPFSPANHNIVLLAGAFRVVIPRVLISHHRRLPPNTRSKSREKKFPPGRIHKQTNHKKWVLQLGASPLNMGKCWTLHP